MRAVITAVAFVTAAVTATSAVQLQNPFLGRWNITGTGDASSYVYWLEVTAKADGTLTGMFLNRVGNPVPLGVVRIENGELVFQTGSAERPSGPEYRAKIDNGRLVGKHTLTSRGRRGADGTRGPATERVIEWVGVRPPEWPDVNASAPQRYGVSVTLVDGTSLDAFGVQHAERPMGWSIEDGAITNQRGANNLVSKATFGDFKVVAEYKLAPESNSGIYLRGRYELQILDDFGKTDGRADLGHMAIYGRKAPDTNASLAPGEWQRTEIVLVGNRVTVTLNGTRIHDNAVIEGITGGALDNDELTPGPIMIQGDHTLAQFRKVVVTPIVK